MSGSGLDVLSFANTSGSSSADSSESSSSLLGHAPESADASPAPASASLALGPAQAERYRAMVVDHFDALWRTLRSLGVPAGGVDDAAQQVFVIAVRKLERIELGSERAFLLGTAVGVAANARRSAARSKEVVDADALAAGVDAHPNPEQAAIVAERRAMVERILDGMPDDLRVVFVFFELEGLTSVEIAALLSLPVGTVSSRLRRAREQFQSDAQRVIARAPESPHNPTMRGQR